MTTCLLALLRDADCHAMARPETGDGFDLIPLPGQESQFNCLARQVMDCPGAFSAFGRHDGEGGYRKVHIIPHDDGTIARAVLKSLKSGA